MQAWSDSLPRRWSALTTPSTSLGLLIGIRPEAQGGVGDNYDQGLGNVGKALKCVVPGFGSTGNQESTQAAAPSAHTSWQFVWVQDAQASRMGRERGCAVQAGLLSVLVTILIAYHFICLFPLLTALVTDSNGVVLTIEVMGHSFDFEPRWSKIRRASRTEMRWLQDQQP